MSESTVVHPSDDYYATSLAVAFALVERDPSLSDLNATERARCVGQIKETLNRYAPLKKHRDPNVQMVVWALGSMFALSVLFYIMTVIFTIVAMEQ